MSTYKLTYFDKPWRGEVARMLFALADQPYEDIRVPYDESMQDWKALKPTLPFGQVPVLEVDGVVLCQSHAINTLLARRFGLAGRTELEQAQVTMATDCIEDVANLLRPIYLEPDFDQKRVLRSRLGERVMPTMQMLEKVLEQNNGGDGYFVGDELTLADVYFLVRCEFPERVGLPIDWSAVPKLRALRDRVAAHPRIAAWIAKRPK